MWIDVQRVCPYPFVTRTEEKYRGLVEGPLEFHILQKMNSRDKGKITTPLCEPRVEESALSMDRRF